MSYKIAVPANSKRLDIIDSNSTEVQRALRLGGLAGYEAPTMTTLLTLFEEQGRDLSFFDVGANMGLYALVCAFAFEPSHVHAFEPTPSTAAVARSVVEANRLDIEVAEIALGDVDGVAALHLSDKSDSSNSLVAGFKPSSAEVSVPVRRLDGYVAEVGVSPSVMKIDVETHEPAVLAGAAQTIRDCRPFIIVEVLHRKGRDHGVEITEAMQPFGYSYYSLGDDPDWVAQPTVVGAQGTKNGDWLLAPTPLPTDFPERWERWRGELAACGPDRNSRIPLLASVRAAFRRGGVAEVSAATQRFFAARRRAEGPPSS